MVTAPFIRETVGVACNWRVWSPLRGVHGEAGLHEYAWRVLLRTDRMDDAWGLGTSDHQRLLRSALRTRPHEPWRHSHPPVHKQGTMVNEVRCSYGT
jgi:hypothetical protein